MQASDSEPEGVGVRHEFANCAEGRGPGAPTLALPQIWGRGIGPPHDAGDDLCDEPSGAPRPAERPPRPGRLGEPGSLEAQWSEPAFSGGRLDTALPEP